MPRPGRAGGFPQRLFTPCCPGYCIRNPGLKASVCCLCLCDSKEACEQMSLACACLTGRVHLHRMRRFESLAQSRWGGGVGRRKHLDPC